MTQNADWTTQFGEEIVGGLSPLPPGSLSPTHINEREKPWGRLLPSCWNNPNSAAGGGIYYDCYNNDKNKDHDNKGNDNDHNNSNLLKPIDLLPCSPERASNCKNKNKDYNKQGTTSTATHPNNNNNEQPGISLLGLSNIRLSDIFNQHVLGRSKKVDVTAREPTGTNGLGDGGSSTTATAVDAKVKAMHVWAHGMISNRHCRIYCCLDDNTTTSTTPTTTTAAAAAPVLGLPQSTNNHERQPLAAGFLPRPPPPPHVYVEDCSVNGTLINRTTVLRKGERRRLHSGDEICLANPHVLQRKIQSKTVLQQVLEQHSFVFVNLLSHRAATPAPPHTLFQQLPAPQAFSTNNLHFPLPSPPTSRSWGRVNPAVNVRAIKHPSHHHEKPRNACEAASPKPEHRLFANPQQHYNNHDRQHSPRPCHPHHYHQNPSSPPEQQRLFEEDYELRDLLGSGTVGNVFRAIHHKTGKELAVKRIPWTNAGLGSRQFHRANNNNKHQQKEPKDHPWLAEAAILRQLNHPYIVDLIDVYVSSTFLYIVMELLPGGDLFDRIVQRERYTETASRRLIRRILSAVQYLHNECNLVHRDLKPENILLTNRVTVGGGTLEGGVEEQDYDIKITDFGLAKACKGEASLKTFCGTPQYFAPEVLQRQLTVTGQGRYGKPVCV